MIKHLRGRRKRRKRRSRKWEYKDEGE